MVHGIWLRIPALALRKWLCLLAPAAPVPQIIMFSKVADNHCHIDVNCTKEDIMETADAIALSPELRDGFFSIMTTYERDMHLLQILFHRLGKTQNKLMPYWGVHPWYSHLFTFCERDGESLASWKEKHYRQVLEPEPTNEMMRVLPDPIDMNLYLKTLQDTIQRCKPPHGKFGIGEIGLDKLFRVPSAGYYGSLATIDSNSPRLSPCKVTMEHQERILQSQLLLAEELQAPISVHCVKSHGRLYAAIEKFRGPTIILHSYTGSIDQAQMWIRKTDKLNQQIFFSFSQWINGEKAAQLRALMEILRDEHILVESDVSIDRYDLETYKLEHIQQIVETVKAIRKWDSLEILSQNIERAIGVKEIEN